MNHILRILLLSILLCCVYGQIISVCTRPHEVYNVCGSPCPLTCQNMYVIEFCIDVCAEDCFCEEGYIRDNCSGNCIKPELCPPLGYECYKALQ